MAVAIAVAVTFAATVLLTAILNSVLARESRVRYRIPGDHPVGDEQFLRSFQHLLPPPVTDGNRVTTLSNGDEIFPAMLDAIRSARASVTFETFIYWSGDVGRQFADAFLERAAAGVSVHVLLDWFGSKRMDRGNLRRLRDGGVQVELYHCPHVTGWWRLNFRTHRKILVVDGRVGFVGGVGIADAWSGYAQDPQHFRDCHFRIEGPAVAQLQGAFMDNWLKSHHRVLHGPDYFPPPEAAGGVRAQVFNSSPAGGGKSMRLMYLMVIAAARRDIRIGSAYFVPDDLAVEALVAARRRGVNVEVILPGEYIDKKIVRHASRARWGPLLEAGVEVYEYQPTMYHCKVMVVDGLWVSAGSSNFDPRSFRLNDESNLNVLDAGFAAEQVRIFEADKARARRVTLEEWRGRPTPVRIKDRLAGLLAGEL